MKINSALAIVTMAALSAPMVVQAQDPMTAYKRVMELAAANQGAEAIKLCDQIIQTYGNPKSRVAAQFIHLVPFFYYQKADILFKAKKYQEAYDTYKKLLTEATFSDKNIRNRAKQQVPPNGFDSLMSISKFQAGYALFQLAVGDPKKKIEGNTAKFAEAIPELEAYLKDYEAGKVSPEEKKAKLDGAICFLLMQAYILKEKPDFNKAGEYLEKSRSARAPLSDEMAMGGLVSVMRVAQQNPDYIEWCYRIVSANPESFNLGTARMAPYIGTMLTYGSDSAKIGQKFLQTGDVEKACGAYRSANMFFGLMPDPPAVNQVLTSHLKRLKLGDKSKVKAIPDQGSGVKHVPATYATILKNYKKQFTDTKKYPEALAVLQSANIGYTLGSKRLMKAGYHIVTDRYPDLQSEKDGKLVSQKDQNLATYSQLCRLTGDDAAADAIDGKVDKSKIDKNSKFAAIIAKMNKAVTEKDWEGAKAASQEVLDALKDDKQNLNYVAALVAHLSASYMLQDWDTVISEGEAIQADAAKPLDCPELKPDQKRNYETQVSFFVLHAYHQKKAQSTEERKENMSKVIELAQKYLGDYADTLEKDNLAPNVYFYCVDALLRRQPLEDEAKRTADGKLALKYCEELIKKFPNHALAPVCSLIGGQILVGAQYANDEEENREKDRGLRMYEDAYQKALALDKKDYNTASDALFYLISYAPEYTREGEDEKGKAARIKGYEDAFWSQIYPEEGGNFTRPGDSNALKLATLAVVNASSGTDAAAYNKALEKARKVIVSEAKYGMEKNVNDPELEKAINGYYSAYVDGSKKLGGKELTMQEKIEHFKNFPGIPKENKYASSLLRMRALKAISEEQMSIRRDKNLADNDKKEKIKALQDTVTDEMDKFTRDYRPEDLSNYICTEVGNNLLADAQARFDAGSLKENSVDATLAYFDKALERGGEYQAEAQLGRAKILALSSQDARKAESADLFKRLADAGNIEALVGVTRLNMRNKDYAAVVKSAENYCARTSAAANNSDSVDMHTMYAQALAQTGDTTRAIQIYLNMFNRNLGAVRVSAPTCKALMELYWNRNKPSSGDRTKGTFKHSDRWTAWNTGATYVRNMKPNESKFGPDERDAFRAVEELVKQYNDPSVQAEDKADKAYAQTQKQKK